MIFMKIHIYFYSNYHGGPFPKTIEPYMKQAQIYIFFVKLPKGVNEKVDKNQFLSFVDFAPTVLSIANIEIPSEYQGKAFIGNFKSKTKYISCLHQVIDLMRIQIKIRDVKIKI